jgi:DNA-binding protein HU-beta
MNKVELIDSIAAKTELSKADATKALNAVVQTITDALKAGEEVNLVGFGNFVVKQRAARKGRNLQTGAEIEIKASKAPAFKPSKNLKTLLNT